MELSPLQHPDPPGLCLIGIADPGAAQFCHWEMMLLPEATGTSILYSAAREYLITVTSRGPWPALVLPTVSFMPPKEKKRKNQK